MGPLAIFTVEIAMYLHAESYWFTEDLIVAAQKRTFQVLDDITPATLAGIRLDLPT
jgi:hypothetical protein